MPRRTPLQRSRLREHLYLGTSERRDNCAGCRHSKANGYDHDLYCHLTSAPVASGSVCASWAPVIKWIDCKTV